jgi:predicted transcriptional regulator
MSFEIEFKDKEGRRGIITIYVPDGSIETAKHWMKEVQEKLLPEYVVSMYGPFELSANDVIASESENQRFLKKLPSSLVRTYIGLTKATKKYGRPVGTDELAEEVGLSRNLTSTYLRKLVDMGYVEKVPNLDKNLPYRWLFKPNELPEETVQENGKKVVTSLARAKHAVKVLFEKNNRPVTAEEVAEEMKVSPNLVRNYLRELARMDEIERLPNIDDPKKSIYVYKPKIEQKE